jgi:RNA polymerase sigma-70 factor (ECF subfamily)
VITEAVLQDFRSGKKEAYDLVYKSYAPGMFGICLRYTRCKDDAQDVLQESFIKVYINREKFLSGQSIGAWIKTITINTALTYIKQNYRLQLTDNELKLDEMHFDSEETPDYASMQQKLLAILNRLPDGYRTVFNLYTVDNLTHKEIAEYLDISENTSKTQLFKAKKMIQAIIEQEKISYGT